MARLKTDGFDKYGPASLVSPTAPSLVNGGWTSAQSTGLSIVSPLSANGQALSFSSISCYVSASIPNTSRVIGGVRFSSNLASTGAGTGVLFLDGAGNQFSVDINPAGQILVRSGATGTILATSASTISANSIHYLEWDVTVSTSGAYQVWLDGTSIISGTGNTRAGTTNNYANVMRLGNFAGTSGQTFVADDFYLFDSTGTTNNAALLTNPVVETQFPNSDLAVQLTSGAALLGQNYVFFSGSTSAPGANQLFLRYFTPAVNMTLNSVSCMPKQSSGTAKFKPVLVTTPAAVTAHRYWRVNILTTAGSINPTISEIEFRTTAGTPRSFSGGTAAASSVQTTNVAANAIDGSTSTQWIAGNSSPPGWWSYDYGAGNSITVAEVWMYATSSLSTGPTSFELQWSDDNITWNTVANFTQAWASTTESHTWQVASRPTTGGSPGSAIVVGTEVVGAVTGVPLTGLFASGQTLTAGVQYGIGFVTDTSVQLQWVDSSATALKTTVTYPTVPSTLPTITGSSQSSWQIWGNCTGATANYPAVNKIPPYDDGAYVSSSTPGVKDLYTFPTLSDNPTTVHCVTVEARVKRTDSGTRTVSVHAVSGTTDSTGSAPGQTPGGSYGWVESAYPVDPNTGAAWTGAAVNAMTGGIEIVS